MSRAAAIVSLFFVVLAAYPLVSVLYEVVARGSRVVSVDFLTTTPTAPFRPGGGIEHAIVGTFLVVAIGTAVGAPMGVLAGAYLSEFGRGRLASIVRLTADVMTGIPSIVAGIFGYSAWVVRHGFSAWAGGIALALILVPIVTRTTEEALRAVPQTYREAGLALGAPAWYTMASVVLPAGAGGVLTGLLLGVARIAGETAPLLLTVLTSSFLVKDPSQPVATLPVLAYDYGKSAYPKLLEQAWGVALVLIAFVFAINLAVRLMSLKRRRLAAIA